MFGATDFPASARRLPSLMSGHDGSTEHGISSGLRFYTGHVADRHRIGRAGAGLRLGYLGLARHLPCLAERAGRFVRCGLVGMRASIVLMVLGLYLR